MNRIQHSTYELSLAYNCINCKTQHWLFLREAQNKDFIVVCECGSVFAPVVIKSFNIVYDSQETEPEHTESTKNKVFDDAVQALKDLGFENNESEIAIQKSLYKTTDHTDTAALVKIALKYFLVKLEKNNEY